MMKPQTTGEHSIRAQADCDIIEGADNIAAFIYGRTTKTLRRRVYNLHDAGELPTFKIGAVIHMRPSTYRAFIEQKEREALARRRAEGRAA